jgi:para-nitrobenzyl esterase
MWHRPWQQWDKEVEEAMSSYWVNFAKTGIPENSKYTKWIAHNNLNGGVFIFDDKIKNDEFDFFEYDYK